MAKTVNLIVKQGATYRFSLRLKNSDGSPFVLTGYNAVLQIRKQAGSEFSPIYCHIDTFLDSEYDQGGSITINALEGSVAVEIDDIVTKEFRFRVGYFDLFLYKDDSPTLCPLDGKVLVKESSTWMTF